MFSANHPPRSNDASEAFFDRWFVVPFNRSFRGTEQEIPSAKLDAKLQSPQQLSGLLNRCLEALQTIRKRHRLTEPESCKEAWQEFHATTDPLSVWLDKFTVDDPCCVVPKDVLRTAYGAECERRGVPPLSDRAFTQALIKVRPSDEHMQRIVNGRRQWCFLGIGLGEMQPTVVR